MTECSTCLVYIISSSYIDDFHAILLVVAFIYWKQHVFVRIIESPWSFAAALPLTVVDLGVSVY